MGVGRFRSCPRAGVDGALHVSTLVLDSDLFGLSLTLATS